MLCSRQDHCYCTADTALKKLTHYRERMRSALPGFHQRLNLTLPHRSRWNRTEESLLRCSSYSLYLCRMIAGRKLAGSLKKNKPEVFGFCDGESSERRKVRAAGGSGAVGGNVCVAAELGAVDRQPGLTMCCLKGSRIGCPNIMGMNYTKLSVLACPSGKAPGFPI